MERSEGGAPESEPSSAVQGRWVWKQVFEPWLPPPSAAHPSPERSAAAESEEPAPKKPRLVSIGGGCCSQGGATQAGEVASRSGLSHNEIADRLSSTSENPQVVNRTPTPDSASAAAMMSKRREGERQERLADPRPMSVPRFDQYVSSDGTIVTMGP